MQGACPHHHCFIPPSFLPLSGFLPTLISPLVKPLITPFPSCICKEALQLCLCPQEACALVQILVFAGKKTTQASFSQSRRFSIRTPGKPGAAVGDIRSAWNHFLPLRLHHSSLSFPASPPPFLGFLCFSIPGDECYNMATYKYRHRQRLTQLSRHINFKHPRRESD